MRGSHATAIRCFMACQRASGINAVAVAPKAEHVEGEPDVAGPLAEVDSLEGLRWSSVAERFELKAGTSVFNLHNVSLAYKPLLRDLRRAGVPYVLTSHGQLGFQTAWRWLKKFVYLNFVNRDFYQAAGLHVLTRFAADRVKWLLPGFRGTILAQGNLLEAPNWSALPPAQRSEYGLPSDAFVLIFLGRLDVPVKGLDLVVEAFSRLPPDRARLETLTPFGTTALILTIHGDDLRVRLPFADDEDL